MAFEFKSFQQILPKMVAKFLSTTGVNDLNPGAVMPTFLEAAAQEDSEQYFQMFQILAAYYVDTAEEDNLDDRAAEIFKLTGVDVGAEDVRLPPQRATTFVTIGDTNITKVSTSIFSGNRGPMAGETLVDVDDASGFDATGSIIIGRETENAETVAYSAITNFGTYYRFTLSAALTNDHGTDETVIFAQGGDRTIAVGTIVKVPESDTSREISYTLSQAATILDGDREVEGVDIAAVEAGSTANVPPNTIVEFENEPFDGAYVTNPQKVTTGRNRETDVELRDRIKDHIQSLSRGTKKAITSGVIGIITQEDFKRVVSANFIETNDPEERNLLYIDDGSGLEPDFLTVGSEQVVDPTTGGEKYFQVQNFPIVKAEIETQSEEPFALADGDALTIEVNDVAETLIFNDSDFELEGSATAIEVATAINDRMNLIEARTTDAQSRVVIRAKADTNENIKVTGGFANLALDFSTEEVFTMRLYRRNEDEIELLTKDGVTAEITNTATELYNLVGGETLTLIVDGKSANPQTVTFQAGDFISVGFATAEEVAARINLELAGAYALTTANGSLVTIKSRNTNSSESQIQVTGGTANAELSFSTTNVVGQDENYSLNRYNGQIELLTQAGAGDTYETGSEYTRGFVNSVFSQSYFLTDGDTITVKVDGGAGQVVTFNTADFNDITQAQASEVATVINEDVDGAYAFATTTGKVTIRTNTWDTTGTIEVDAITGTAGNIGFPVGTIKTSLFSHVPHLVSASNGPYNLIQNDNLIVVIDNDPDNYTFNITMDLAGEVTIGDGAAPYDTLIAKIISTNQNFNLRFTETGDLADFKLQWTSGSNAPTSVNILSYDGTTGTIVLASAQTNSIDAGDQFIIIPRTTKNTVTYLNNSITSSFSAKGLASLSDGYVQIESLTLGSDGGINVTGGSANAELQFSTTPQEGRDGYKYYTGLLQRVQHTVDGLDSDLDNFEGIRAGGVQIEVLPPVINKVTVNVNVSLSQGFLTATVRDQVISAISSYVNGLKVGADIVVSKIIDEVMNVTGIVDVEMIEPTENIAIADNEIARVDSNQILVS